MGKKAVGALFLAAAALPAAQAFLPAPVPGTSRVLRAAPLRMCQTPAEFRAAAAKPLQQQALAAFSALCIGGAVAPASARARELSVEAFAAQAEDSVALVAEATANADKPSSEVDGGRQILKAGGVAVVAGAAGFGSVILLRRKGGEDDPTSPQAWADGKQQEWKVLHLLCVWAGPAGRGRSAAKSTGSDGRGRGRARRAARERRQQTAGRSVCTISAPRPPLRANCVLLACVCHAATGERHSAWHPPRCQSVLDFPPQCWRSRPRSSSSKGEHL